MNVHDRLARIQITHQRIEPRITKELFIVAREQRDAFETKRFEAVTRFADGGVDIVHRQQTKTAEAARIQRHQLRGVVVDTAGEGRPPPPPPETTPPPPPPRE